MHVHVQRDRSTAKFWLNPVSLAGSHGFAARELTRIRALILEHRTRIQEGWREHCGG